jgi:hypothetical protein
MVKAPLQAKTKKTLKNREGKTALGYAKTSEIEILLPRCRATHKGSLLNGDVQKK